MTASVGSGSARPPGRARAGLRAGAVRDAPEVARLHARHIPTGFLAVLGPRLLTRLYRRVARTDDCFLLVAERDGTIVGFLAGSLDTRRLMRRFVLLDGPAVIVSTGWEVLRHWRRVLETLGHGARRIQTDETGVEEPASQPEAELLAVAVDDGFRGSGLGSTLTRAFLDEATHRGAGSARVVVGVANRQAIGMYRRCGFATVEQFEHHRGAMSVLMRCSLARPRAEQSPAERGGPG